MLVGGILLVQRQISGPIEFSSTDSLVNTNSQSSLSNSGLQIPSLNINLPIQIEEVKNKKWPISKSGVIRIKNTNVFYGHNWPRLLGKLPTIKTGAEIYIDGIGYKVVNFTKVYPNQSEILQSANTNYIVLYTCTGLFDLQRFVVIAKVLQ